MPWLVDGQFPDDPRWASIAPLEVAINIDRGASYWGGIVPGGQERLVIPPGATFGRPSIVMASPPVGAYVCGPAPDDGSDREPWWVFPLAEPVGRLRAGAVIGMRPGHGTLIVPLGHPALRDPALAMQAVAALCRWW